MRTAHIEVFVTRNMQFRAKIKPVDSEIAYEVTIGSESWKKGKGRRYQDIIEAKCQAIINTLLNDRTTHFYKFTGDLPTDQVALPNMGKFKNLNYTPEELGYTRKYKGRFINYKGHRYLITEATPYGVYIRNGLDDTGRAIFMDYSELKTYQFI